MEVLDMAVHTAGTAGRRLGFIRILVFGMLLYAASIFVLVFTRNPNIFPTVVIIGSFLVPVTYVAFFYERRGICNVNMPTTAACFLYGGVLSTLVAGMLEPIFIRTLTFPTAFIVGLIEEFAKILGVLLIARHKRHNSELDGIILGAAAGMGFAAFESTGYAFTAFLRSGGSLSYTVFVTLIRAIMSPVGHGTWTAILASVLFRESGTGKFHFNFKVMGAYVLVAGLHGLWDGGAVALPHFFRSTVPVFGVQIALGILGFIILYIRWREARLRRSSEDCFDYGQDYR